MSRASRGSQHAANPLVTQPGDDRLIFGGMQADRRAEAGDMEGHWVWLSILVAIKE